MTRDDFDRKARSLFGRHLAIVLVDPDAEDDRASRRLAASRAIPSLVGLSSIATDGNADTASHLRAAAARRWIEEVTR